MKKIVLTTAAVLLSVLLVLPAAAQRGMGGGMMGYGQGYGMGGGMMGYPIAPDVPDKLPAPKSQEWLQKLRDVLALERLSYAQYTADAEKFNTWMPYHAVIPQEEDHVRAIERLFAAYGMPAEGKPAAVAETKTITEALDPVSYTHLRAHETVLDLVCRLLLEKKKIRKNNYKTN